MIFKTHLEIRKQRYPLFPEQSEFCCLDLYTAFRNRQIVTTLDDDELELICVLEKKNPTNVKIHYCPFCGTKFEFEEIEDKD